MTKKYFLQNHIKLKVNGRATKIENKYINLHLTLINIHLQEEITETK